MSNYNDDVIEVSSDTEEDNPQSHRGISVDSSSHLSRIKTETPRSADDRKKGNYSRRSKSRDRNRSLRLSSPDTGRKSKYGEKRSSHNQETSRSIRSTGRNRSHSPRRSSPTNYRSNRSDERKLEEGERNSSERRNASMQDSARPHIDREEINRDKITQRNADEPTRKRKRNHSSSSNDCATMSEDTNNELPMTLTWTTVEKVKNREGERVYPSGHPRLSEAYKTQLEEIEKEKKQNSKERSSNEPKPKQMKTLTMNFQQMKQDFTGVKDWLEKDEARPQKHYKDERGKERKVMVAVQRWPEPNFLAIRAQTGDDPANRASGMNTLEERRRWHLRSRYEAVYVCDKEKQYEAMEKKRQQTDRGRARNSNMEVIGTDRNRSGNANTEAIGQRSRPDSGRQLENLLPPEATERPKDSSQGPSRRSTSREKRDSRPIKREGEDRRRTERQVDQDNSYNDRGHIGPEREGYDRYSLGGQENESRRERSPKGYNRNRIPIQHAQEPDRSLRAPTGRETYQERQPERREYAEIDQNRTHVRPRSPPPMSRGPRTPPTINFPVKTEDLTRGRHEDRRSPPRDSYSSSLRDYQQMRRQENYSSRGAEGSSLQSSRNTSRRDSYDYDNRQRRTEENDGYVKSER